MRDLRLLTMLVATAIILSGCAAEPPASLTRISHPSTLAGTTWRLLSIQGRPVPLGPDVTLTFDDADRVSGNGGCNGFGGQFTYEPATGAIRVSNRVSTLRECFEQVRSDLESAYFNALAGAIVANMDSAGHLVLGGSAAELVFEVGPQQVGVPIDASPSGPTAP
jgi:heat shock protein HslJ